MHYADFSSGVFKESAKVIFKGLSTKGNWEKKPGQSLGKTSQNLDLADWGKSLNLDLADLWILN